MKRLSYILLAAMLVAALAVSCTAEVIDDSLVAMVRFTENSGARALEVSREDISVGTLYWKYDAVKVSGPASGAVTGKYLGQGLSNEAGPFSLGDWNFTLYGYKDKECKTLMYKGTGTGTVEKDKTNTIRISVEPQMSQNGKGSLHISKSIQLTKDGVVVKGSDGEATYKATHVVVTRLSDGEEVVTGDTGDYWTADVTSGSYKVVVSFVDAATEITHAENTVYVNVFDGLTTVISGTLDEVTSSISFDADVKEGRISETKTVTPDTETGNVSASFGFSPVSNESSTGNDVLGTTIEGAFTGSGSIELNVYGSEGASRKFAVENENSVVSAGFDINLSEGLAVAENRSVTITTYIQPGLTGTVNVVYRDEEGNVPEEGQPSVVSYEVETGKLVFTTTHFSEYYVVSDSVAENATTGKKYATLQEAIDSANDGNEIKMLSNVVLKNNVVFSQDYYVTLNMDGKEILLDVNPNAETAGLLLVKGKARLVITGAGSFDYTSEYENEGIGIGYLISVIEDAELTVEDGFFNGCMGCIRLGKLRNVPGETAKVYINGGSFKSAILYPNNATAHYWTFNKMDGTTTSFVITGGTFYKFNPAKGGTENPDEDWVAEGYCASSEEIDGDTWYTAKKAVAEVDGSYFASLVDAINAAKPGATITLLCDASGDGIGLYSNPKDGQTKTKDIIIDFNSFTYTINGELQGSTGYVSQAFHLEKDCTVVLKNGKLTSNNAKMLIQNYCNLTLDGMELDFVESGRDYALSNNCGDVHIKDTRIKVASGKIAFDSCKFSNYSIPTVTISGTSEIDGMIELSGGKLVCPSDLKEKIKYFEGFEERYRMVDDSGVLTFEVAKYIKNESDFEKVSLIPILPGKNFKDANANKLNGYYVLENDITVDHLIYIAEGSTATIDLNGYKITSRFEGFSIGNWGKLTIHDSSENKSGIVYNACKTFGNDNFGHDAIRNFGELVIDGGTFGDQDTDKENENKVNFGAALNNQKGATATIKSGNFTTGDNYWKDVEGKNGFSYAIRNFGTLTVEDWHVYGKMNGGVAGDAGTMYLNGGKVEITNPSSWHTLTVESTSGAKIYISGGEYINNNTNGGHLFSAFKGMPSWEVTELEKNGYFVTGGTFIEDGVTKTFTV